MCCVVLYCVTWIFCLTSRIFINMQFIYLSLIYTTPVTSSTIRQSISDLNDINEIFYCKQSSCNATASVKLIDLLIILNMWCVMSGRWMMLFRGVCVDDEWIVNFYNFIQIEVMHNWILFINLFHTFCSLMCCRHIHSLVCSFSAIYYDMPKISRKFNFPAFKFDFY